MTSSAMGASPSTRAAFATGEVRSGLVGRGAQQHRCPPLLGDELLPLVHSPVQQRDAEVVLRWLRAVQLDQRLQALSRHDGPMEQEVVLAVDTTARLSEQRCGDELQNGWKLRRVGLGGDGGGGECGAVDVVLVVVEGRTGEGGRQVGVEHEVEGPRTIADPQDIRRPKRFNQVRSRCQIGERHRLPGLHPSHHGRGARFRRGRRRVHLQVVDARIVHRLLPPDHDVGNAAIRFAGDVGPPTSSTPPVVSGATGARVTPIHDHLHRAADADEVRREPGQVHGHPPEDPERFRIVVVMADIDDHVQPRTAPRRHRRVQRVEQDVDGTLEVGPFPARAQADARPHLLGDRVRQCVDAEVEPRPADRRPLQGSGDARLPRPRHPVQDHDRPGCRSHRAAPLTHALISDSVLALTSTR